MTYTELQTELAAYFKRSDLTSRIVSAIGMAEAFLFREVSAKSISDTVPGTTTGGLITLPSDFDSVIRLTVTIDGVERNLDYVSSPDDYVGGTNTPYAYSFQGNQLRLFPNVGTGQAYTLYYTPKLQSLSGTVSTNWLLENAQDLYFYAAALQVATVLNNSVEVAKLTPIVSDLLVSTRNYAERFGQPKASRLQIKVRR